MTEHYLDNSATTRPSAAAKAAAMAAFECFGNPSSMHAAGFAAEQTVSKAREQIARCVGCLPEEVYFTSGGTEANNLAILGAANALQKRGKRIITTRGEHPSVARTVDALEAKGFDVVRLSTRGGTVDEAELAAAITKDTILVSMMLVNNETGAVYPVQKVKKMLAGTQALLHIDGVQGFGKLPFTLSALGADMVSLSAHKVGGLKGCGALVLRKGARIQPPNYGGGQEKGLRSGTENVPGIAAFGAAAEACFAALPETRKRLTALRDYGEKALEELGAVVHRPPLRAPQILSVHFPGFRAETLLHYLSARGVYVSAGSACSAKKAGDNPVLEAFGLTQEERAATLRISLGADNTAEDMDALLSGLRAAYSELTRK